MRFQRCILRQLQRPSLCCIAFLNFNAITCPGADGVRLPAPPPPMPTGRGSRYDPVHLYGAHGYHQGGGRYGAANPYAYGYSDVVRTDLDEQRLLNNFAAVESLKVMCALPDMLLDPWERRWRAYDNRNGRVFDPVRELEEERVRARDLRELQPNYLLHLYLVHSTR